MSLAGEIIVKPIVTEKSNSELSRNIYTFQVVKTATKIDVRNAIEKMYKVKVAQVNTTVVKGKVRRVGRFVGKQSDWKKAIVILKQGQKIESLVG